MPFSTSTYSNFELLVNERRKVQLLLKKGSLDTSFIIFDTTLLSIECYRDSFKKPLNIESQIYSKLYN